MKIHQSGNQIIVTELNPMSDAPVHGTFLVFTTDAVNTWEVYKTNKGAFVTLDGYKKFNKMSLKGWLPMPVYDQSAKSPEDRYEKLRRLNPAQFYELHERNLRGENFDEMVDAL